MQPTPVIGEVDILSLLDLKFVAEHCSDATQNHAA